jgi:hypothetical protein
MKTLLFVGKNSIQIPYPRVRRYKIPVESVEIRSIRKFWYITLLLDPDPDLHSRSGSGFRRAKSMRLHADPDPQHSW